MVGIILSILMRNMSAALAVFLEHDLAATGLDGAVGFETVKDTFKRREDGCDAPGNGAE